jgi:hypothetical protein
LNTAIEQNGPGGEEMSASVLMVTPMLGAANCAAALEQQLGCGVDVANGREEALFALQRREYSVVIVEESLVEADFRGADLMWKHAGLAVPLQVNFGITGSSRLAREVRAALARREQEQAIAMRAARSTMEAELNVTVTGLLLHSQLALSEPAIPPHISEKLKIVIQLAGHLRERLNHAQESAIS